MSKKDLAKLLEKIKNMTLQELCKISDSIAVSDLHISKKDTLMREIVKVKEAKVKARNSSLIETADVTLD